MRKDMRNDLEPFLNILWFFREMAEESIIFCIIYGSVI